MVFGKPELIPLKGEDFETFMTGFGYCWDSGMSAKKIAEEMGFGERGCWAEKLTVKHVYYVASKYSEEYGLTPRRKHRTEASKAQIPHFLDMPTETESYLRDKGLLVGQKLE